MWDVAGSLVLYNIAGLETPRELETIRECGPVLGAQAATGESEQKAAAGAVLS